MRNLGLTSFPGARGDMESFGAADFTRVSGFIRAGFVGSVRPGGGTRETCVLEAVYKFSKTWLANDGSVGCFC